MSPWLGPNSDLRSCCCQEQWGCGEGRVLKWPNGWVDGWMDKWTDEWVEEWVGEGQMDECTDRRMDDGWMGRQMD